jgi:hypothetical protein
MQTLEDPVAEALRLVGIAKTRNIVVRLMGGLAFHACSPDWSAPAERPGRDIDLATRGRDRMRLARVLTTEGYLGDETYNTLHGQKQMYFVDEARHRPVDVLVDRLEMCHTLNFRDRLEVTYPTIPFADLLLSKLQVVKANRKDLVDAASLLSEWPLTADDSGISLDRIRAVTASDWGWWRTVKGNVDRLKSFSECEVELGELEFGRAPRYDAVAQLTALGEMIETEQKSLGWRLRAVVGDRMSWYQEPEEVSRTVDAA